MKLCRFADENGEIHAGLVVGWLYLKGPRDMRLEFQYRLSQWRMNRLRRRFDVHRGGRDDWENRIH